MLITFEGPDGSGKTTQLALLAEHLGQQGYLLFQVREPGGTPIGEQVRNVLHSMANQEMNPRAEVLLFSASRAQLIEQAILPALAEGKIVLCDRFYDSTFAYQGYGRGLDLEALRQLTQFATRGLCPDLTVYIEISPEEGLRRRRQDKSVEWNRLDDLPAVFHRRVHEGYQRLIAAEPDRWVVIDGERSIEAVQADVRAAVLARLPQS
ncbi:MAG: dTMP kinase [Anaerolineae bacterium]|nr:dTMP kinase [Anaerolineae bacterium]